MKKIFRLSFLTILLTNLYFTSAWAQEIPDDPPVEPPIDAPPDTSPGEPTDPDLPPELVNVELNEADSKELFTILDKWKLVIIDRETQIKRLQTSDVVCVENLEDSRQLGCSLYDDLRSREVYKYNKNADPLFKTLVKHIAMECDDESETCMLTAEKLACSLSANIYSCSMEILVPQPKPKKGRSK